MKWVNFKRLKPVAMKAGLTIAGVSSTFVMASADLAGDLSNLSTVITSYTGWVTDIMAIFMNPPLVIFVGMAVGSRVFGKIRGLLSI